MAQTGSPECTEESNLAQITNHHAEITDPPGITPDLCTNLDELSLPKTLDFNAALDKKKKKKKERTDVSEMSHNDSVDGTGALFLRGKLYPYSELLDRIQDNILKSKPDLQGAKKYTIKPPQLARIGSKKVAWTNFQDICKIMQRSSEHVLQFVLSELGTEGSIGGDGHLTLKGKFGPKHIESLLRKYITEYVTCSMCKSPNTVLNRDSSARLHNITCAACGASRSVTTIKTGFLATTRHDRRKLKNAT